MSGLVQLADRPVRLEQRGALLDHLDPERVGIGLVAVRHGADVQIHALEQDRPRCQKPKVDIGPAEEAVLGEHGSPVGGRPHIDVGRFREVAGP